MDTPLPVSDDAAVSYRRPLSGLGMTATPVKSPTSVSYGDVATYRPAEKSNQLAADADAKTEEIQERTVELVEIGAAPVEISADPEIQQLTDERAQLRQASIDQTVIVLPADQLIPSVVATPTAAGLAEGSLMNVSMASVEEVEIVRAPQRVESADTSTILPARSFTEAELQTIADLENKTRRLTSEISTATDSGVAASKSAELLSTQAQLDAARLGGVVSSEPVNALSLPPGNAAPETFTAAAADEDWRCRIRIAPSANYLYRAQDPGVLAPLQNTDGVLFPYTPKIDTVYHAQYSETALPHSNWKGYFYSGSYPGDIQLNGKFTAQDNYEAKYLLAVIHFFRSASKMFYGQDLERGTPPPVLFLSAFGQHHYNNAPVLLKEFSLTYPDDVDYIRVDAGSQGTTSTTLFKSIRSTRLSGTGVAEGGAPVREVSIQGVSTIANQLYTYVPVMFDIQLTLAPLQNRETMSSAFSFRDFANGKLIKKGFF